MIKITDIEAELANQTPREIHYKEVPLEFIHECSRLFKTDVDKGGSENIWTVIKKGKVELTLNTSKY